MNTAPPGWPLVGHLPAFLRDKLGFLAHCAVSKGISEHLSIHAPGPFA